jgi:hypothetical protein
MDNFQSEHDSFYDVEYTDLENVSNISISDKGEREKSFIKICVYRIALILFFLSLGLTVYIYSDDIRNIFK